MSLVTTDEFANYLGGWQFSPVQKTEAESILDGVQSDLERYLNRPVQMRRVLEKVRPERGGLAYVKVTPIVSVHGAYRFGEFESQGPAVESDFPLVWTPGDSMIRCGGSVWLDYTGGINGDVHPGIKSAIKRVAKRIWPHTHDSGASVRSTESRPGEGGQTDTTPGWTIDELKQFDRLRRRVVL